MLVVMLVMSMMMGVITVSASADEEDLPELMNEPVFRYFDRYYFKSMYDSEREGNDWYSDYYGYFRPEIDIAVRMDSSNC